MLIVIYLRNMRRFLLFTTFLFLLFILFYKMKVPNYPGKYPPAGSMLLSPCSCVKNIDIKVWNGDRKTFSTCSDKRSSLGLNQSVISFSFYIPSEKWSKVEAQRKYLIGKGKPKVNSFLFKNTFTKGILQNLKGMRVHYPGWVMRLYTNVDVDSDLCEIICKNDDLFWCDIRELPEGNNMSTYYGKTWRFLPLGDPTVDLFSVRDLDSFISKREADAVEDWLGTRKEFYLFRDFPEGHDQPILGGLWGGSNSLIGYDLAKNIGEKLMEKSKEKSESKWALDQDILGQIVYFPYETMFVAYDSYHCKKWNGSGNVRPFPTQREGRKFLGSQTLWNISLWQPPCPLECRPEHGKDWKYC